MKSERTQKTHYQKTLWIISLLLAVMALVTALLNLWNFVPFKLAIFFLFSSNIAKCCSEWKERPVLNTVFIGIDSFLLGMITCSWLLK